MQGGLRALRSNESFGLLVTGIGQQGKSSLAARILRRLDAEFRPIVCYGRARFDAQSLYFAVRDGLGLGERDPARWPEGRVPPSGGPELGQVLFEVLSDRAMPPFVLVLDDFEQILDAKRDPVTLEPDYQDGIRHLLRAFRAAQGHGSRVIITSRYGFEVRDVDGRDLVAAHLTKLPLKGMGPDAARKLRSAAGLPSGLRDRCVQLGYGNPGLTDLLLTLAQTDAEAAERALEKIAAQAVDDLERDEVRQFFSKVLLDALLALLSEGQKALLAASTLFEVPVPLEVGPVLATATVSDANRDPARLLELGLWERQRDLADRTRDAFMANALVAQLALPPLGEDEVEALAQAVLPALVKAWGSGELPRPIRAELGRLAARAGDLPVAEAHFDDAVRWYFEVQHRPPVAVAVGRRVLALAGAASCALDPYGLVQLAQASERTGDRAVHAMVRQQLAERAPSLEPRARAQAYIVLGDAALREGRPTGARTAYEAAVEASRAAGNQSHTAMALGKLAQLHVAQGRIDEALRILQEELLPAFEALGAFREKAVTMGEIADVYQVRGQLDEALRIRREEQLPVYEALGDVREKAVAMGKIADVYQVRGQLDEALRIYREEQLPVFEALGAVRDKALTMGKIANVHHARGELDEALRIYKEEQLPVYEALGDLRQRVVPLGSIADVCRARGQLDEALRILREQVLPVYEAFGDVHSRAVTMGKIADVYQARDQLDEALRIHREALLIYEALGDFRGKAVSMAKIADVLEARGQLDEALRIRREEALPAFEALGDLREKAVTMGKMANVYQFRGQLEEALHIHRQEVLPVCEALGDVQGLLVTWTNIALLLMRRGRSDDAATVVSLLVRAYQAARAHGFTPERAQIAAIIQGIGLPSPEDAPDAFAELVRRLESVASSSAHPQDPEDP